MTQAKHTPGPWFIAKEKGASRPFNVMRLKAEPKPYFKYDYLKNEDGGNFKTEDEAIAAIAKATGGAA